MGDVTTNMGGDPAEAGYRFNTEFNTDRTAEASKDHGEARGSVPAPIANGELFASRKPAAGEGGSGIGGYQNLGKGIVTGTIGGGQTANAPIGGSGGADDFDVAFKLVGAVAARAVLVVLPAVLLVGDSPRPPPAYQSSGSRPVNASPEGAGRQGAFNSAKRDSGIPTSMQPSRTGVNRDRRGNVQPGRSYEFDVPGKGTITIRDDAGGHIYVDDLSQNRGPHFNTEDGTHYDY